MRLAVGQAVVGGLQVFQGLGGGIGDGLGAVHPHHRAVRQLGEEGLLRGSVLVLQVGHDDGLGEPLHAQLVQGVEAPHALHGVAEELDAVGAVAAVAEHVHDAAAQAELAGLVYEVGGLEAGLL